MDWLLYATQAAAQSDVAIIDGRSNFTNDVTTTWAVPLATADGKWAVPTPTNTTGLSGTPGEPSWPVPPTPNGM